MTSPRVLQVVLSLNAGGTERLVVELVKRLQSEIPMAVCCLDDEGVWASELQVHGVPVQALRRPNGFRPALGHAIARLAAQHRANVIHCHHYSPFVYGCLARIWRPRARVMFTEHGRLSDAGPSPKRKVANVVFARIPRAVFAVSGDLRDHLIAEGFSEVDVIYNGIDVGPVPDPSLRTDVRRRLGAAGDTVVVGTIARLDVVKDLGTLIEAVAVAGRRMPAMLVIVGDGSERSRLEDKARELGATGCVRFLGHRDDAREWLSGCDVYANTSISEGVSLTILEAMAAALPVVATRVGGTPEVVNDSCGRLVPPRSSAAVSSALLELADAPELRRGLGQAARERVAATFSLDRMVREYRDVYHRLT